MVSCHLIDERGSLRRSPFPQFRPEGLILDLVMGMQEGEEKIDVIRHDGGALEVPWSDTMHQCRQQGELPPEHGVYLEHVAGVGARLRNRF